jgi:uncharacterized membrane protein YdbT with pleckstrin-like domain
MRFSVKPVFIGWLTIVTLIPLQLFFTLWAGLFFGGFASFFLRSASSSLPGILSAVVAFLGIPVVLYTVKRLNYERTEYKFFDDRLEFEEGFFSLNSKTIKLRDIRELTLRKGLLQRLYGLGTIYLATPATGTLSSSNAFAAIGFGSISSSGIIVRDVADPDETYARIGQIVERSRASGSESAR